MPPPGIITVEVPVWESLFADGEDLCATRSVQIVPVSVPALWDAVWSVLGEASAHAPTRRLVVLSNTGHIVALLALSSPSRETRRAMLAWLGMKCASSSVRVSDAHLTVVPPYSFARGDALVLYALVYSNGLPRMGPRETTVALRLVDGHFCTGDEFPCKACDVNPLLRFGLNTWFLRLAPNAEAVLTGEQVAPERYRGNPLYGHYWYLRWAREVVDADWYPVRAAESRAALLARLQTRAV